MISRGDFADPRGLWKVVRPVETLKSAELENQIQPRARDVDTDEPTRSLILFFSLSLRTTPVGFIRSARFTIPRALFSVQLMNTG